MRMTTAPSPFSTTSMSSDYDAQDYYFSESKDGIRLSIDLPGVKNKDVNVEFENDTLCISGIRYHHHHHHHDPCHRSSQKSFLRRFAIDGNVVDTSNTKANLVDGVLVITAPKKAKEEDRIVPITTNQHTSLSIPADQDGENKDNNNTFTIVVDVPGVKSSDLKVDIIEDGKIMRVAGHRHGRAPFVRLFSIDNAKETIDTSKLEGSLADGVLVLKAPKKTKTVNSEKENKIKITVTSHYETEKEEKMEEENQPSVEVVQDVNQDEKLSSNSGDKNTDIATNATVQIDQSHKEEEDIEVKSGKVEVTTVTEMEVTNTEEAWEEL